MSVRGSDLLVVGFAGPSLTTAERRLLRLLQPGGMILFRRNIESAEQLLSLNAELEALCPRSLLFLDAEGGRVDRLAGIVGGAPAGGDLARARPAAAAQAGRWVGEALRHFGFAVDFAPVVDLNRGEKENALDGRYLGDTPRAVIARGRAFLRGLHGCGIGGCVKHFPGLGAARMDTHLAGAPIELSRAALDRDLAPFAALGNEARMVMVSHASYPALDPSGRPASLSNPISTDLLRRELEFRGVLSSDDLEMGALAPWGDLPQRCVGALVAGCDLLPVCRTLEAGPEIAAALGARRLAARREEAGARVDLFRRHRRSLLRGASKAVPLSEIRAALSRLSPRLVVRDC